MSGFFCLHLLEKAPPYFYSILSNTSGGHRTTSLLSGFATA